MGWSFGEKKRKCNGIDNLNVENGQTKNGRIHPCCYCKCGEGDTGSQKEALLSVDVRQYNNDPRLPVAASGGISSSVMSFFGLGDAAKELELLREKHERTVEEMRRRHEEDLQVQKERFRKLLECMKSGTLEANMIPGIL